jgi:hypothetical protein
MRSNRETFFFDVQYDRAGRDSICILCGLLGGTVDAGRMMIRVILWKAPKSRHLTGQICRPGQLAVSGCSRFNVSTFNVNAKLNYHSALASVATTSSPRW